MNYIAKLTVNGKSVTSSVFESADSQAAVEFAKAQLGLAVELNRAPSEVAEAWNAGTYQITVQKTSRPVEFPKESVVA